MGNERGRHVPDRNAEQIQLENSSHLSIYSFSMEMDVWVLIKSCTSARWLLLILEVLLRILENLQHGS